MVLTSNRTILLVLPNLIFLEKGEERKKVRKKGNTENYEPFHKYKRDFRIRKNSEI